MQLGVPEHGVEQFPCPFLWGFMLGVFQNFTQVRCKCPKRLCLHLFTGILTTEPLSLASVLLLSP